MTPEQIQDRLDEIQRHERQLQKTLRGLFEERTRLLAQLRQGQADPPPADQPRNRNDIKSLPMGKPIPPAELRRLKQEIHKMDPSAWETQGRAFIARWYPNLCKLPAWHELSTALQRQFSKSRQQVAGIAAVVVRSANSTDAVH